MKTVEWTQEPGDYYLVTGVDRNGKRFKIKTSSWAHCRGINLWRGTKWLVRNGKKKRLTYAFN